MSRRAAYLGMAGIVLLLLAADAWILTSSAALSRLAERELSARFGDRADWERLTMTLSGTVTLEGVSLRGHPVSVERVVVRTRGLLDGGLEEVALSGVRAELTEKLIEELSKPKPEEEAPVDLPRIVVRGGEITVSFPEVLRSPLRVEVGTVRATPLDGRRIHVEGDVTAGLLGTWRARGTVDPEGEFSLLVANRGWTLVPELRGLLAENPAAIYDKYRPGGICDVAVRVEQAKDGKPDFTATIRARDMSLVYRPFAWPVDRARGEIEFRADGFLVKHMTARHGEAVVRFDGAAEGYREEDAYAFRVEVDGAVLDGDLRAALDEDARRIWDLLEPGGRVSVRGRALHDAGPGLPHRVPLNLRFEKASIRYREFPYALSGISGEVSIDGNDVAVRGLRAGGIRIEGSVADITEEARIDLAIEATGLPLDDRLRSALPEDVRAVWDRFSPKGAADVSWRVRQDPGQAAVHAGTARLRGNSALLRDVPLPVTDLEGEVRIEEDGTARLRHVSGRMHGATVEVNGTVREGSVLLDELDVVGLKLDDPLREALPAGAGELLRQLRLTGTVNFSSSLKLPADGDPEFVLNLRLQDGVIATDPKFERIEGHLMLVGGLGKEPFVQGPMTFSRAEVWGKRLRDVSASLQVRGPWVTFRNIRASAYGGVVAGDFTINTKTGELLGGDALTIDRLDMAQYVRDTEGYSGKQVAGKLSLRVTDLKGLAGDAGSVTGKGRLTIRDAVLWDVPVFSSLLSLNPQDLFAPENVFEAGAVDFTIAERKFAIDTLAFTSPNVHVVGRGHVGFDGKLHLFLSSKADRFLGIDFFLLDLVTEPLGWLKDGLVGVEVTGTFDEPKTGVGLFQGFK